jgi:hypothetical protein
LFKKFSIEVAKDYYNIKLREPKNYDDFEKLKSESPHFELFTELNVPEMMKKFKTESKDDCLNENIVETEKNEEIIVETEKEIIVENELKQEDEN